MTATVYGSLGSCLKLFLCFQVFENGKVSGEFIYYFNLREAMKGVDREKAMLRVCLTFELTNVFEFL